MKKRICTLLVLITVFINLLRIPVSADTLASSWDSPVVKPPGTHPSVYFTQADIDGIKANIEAEENTLAKQYLEKYVLQDLPTSTVYNTENLAMIECCAFYYAIYGDETAGQKAIDGIELIKSMTVSDTDITFVSRKCGRMLTVLSEIYDWCNPLITTEEQKLDIIAAGEALAEKMEIGWPPTVGNSITGHSAERDLLRDMLSFSIAVYDERPDIWECVGGRFYDEYVPARQFIMPSHWYHQGVDYGVSREIATNDAYALITGMGAPEPWSGEDMAKMGYTELYLRRPDGYFLQDGDVYSETTLPFGYLRHSSDGIFMSSAAGSDPYLKDEVYRKNVTMVNGELSQSFTDSSPVLYLILSNPELSAKTRYDLPLSKYFPSPAGVMAARTGWEDGTESDSVAAVMKIGEYNFNNHQHSDCGSFQIYYKGLLAAEGGNYVLYGDNEHLMYTTKSIAHNTVLIYDPTENNGSVARSNVNDGGQRAVNNASAYKNIDELKEKGKQAEILAHEIDPENTQKPYYTYLKGDLTNAYSSDKAEEFKRSFMFLNLKNEEIPAAMIVFDKVVSTDKTFKKTWLMHGVEAPEISGNVSTFKNTKTNGDYKYNGQMVVETLLPKADNLSAETVGNTTDGFGIVRGWEYDVEEEKWNVTSSTNYNPDTSTDNERNTYRLELSPKTASEEDYFLNVIIVGDNGKDISVDAPLLETDAFYGTAVCDRVVFFSKDGEDNTAFEYNLEGSGEYRYTICDMAAGTYSISTGGTVKTASVSEEGGVLSFTAPGGSISVTKTSDAYTAPADSEKEVITDRVYLKDEKIFIPSKGITKETDLKVSVTDLAETLGYTVKSEKIDGVSSYIIYKGIEKLAQIKPGETKIHTRSGTYYASVAPYINESNELTMLLSDLSGILTSYSRYLNFANTLYVYNNENAPDVISATGYIDSNKLYTAVKVSNGYSADIIAAAKKDGELLGAQKLTDRGNGCYDGSMSIADFADEDYEVILYAWGDDLYPLTSAKSPEETPAYTKVRASLKGNLTYYPGGTSSEKHFTKTTSGAKVTFTRTNDTNETRVYTNQITGYITDEGILHYSANIRMNELFGAYEYMQFRMRAYMGDTVDYRAHRLKSFNGAECKIDCILDLQTGCAYLYENGELVETWNEGFTKSYSFEEYVVNYGSERGDTQFEVFDSFMAFYPDGTDIEKVKATVGKFNIFK